MNRDQKAVGDRRDRRATSTKSQAIFAVDYRGITVAQVAELRSQAARSRRHLQGRQELAHRARRRPGRRRVAQGFLAGPTALTFVRGDVAAAAKAIADYARTTQLLPFKGGIMDGSPLDVEQIRSLSRLPSREVLYGQLVGVVASPVSGLVRTLSGAPRRPRLALGQVRDKKESGEIPAGEAPAPAEEAPLPRRRRCRGAAEEAPPLRHQLLRRRRPRRPPRHRATRHRRRGRGTCRRRVGDPRRGASRSRGGGSCRGGRQPPRRHKLSRPRSRRKKTTTRRTRRPRPGRRTPTTNPTKED